MLRPSIGKKEHVIYKEGIAYIPQSKLLMYQFKTRHAVCGHRTYKEVYTDKRYCKEPRYKSNPDHAKKACRGNTDIDPLILTRQKTGLL